MLAAGTVAVVTPAGLGVRDVALATMLGSALTPGGAAVFALLSRTALLAADLLLLPLGVALRWVARGQSDGEE